MTQPIAFVTGNGKKFATAAEHLARQGIAVEQVPLHLDEIQHNSVSEVALHKARQAYDTLPRPLFVEDSGFGITEFGGWPGPMAKHLVDAVGAAGIAHIADLTATRACRFVSALVFIDRAGPQVFLDEGEPGRIAMPPVGGAAADAWSPLWQVFIAPGTSVPLAALTGTERDAVFDRWRAQSVFARLGCWLNRRG